jgi:TetR/AcrR family transcriptional regulator, regulator of biofilm formation and stress response
MPNDVPAARSSLGTRERILHATVELMAEIGADRVRTRSIAERAGVNPALVHYHFGSVSALVMEAAQDALLRTLGPSLEALKSGRTIGESVRAILDWLKRYGERSPGSTILAEAMVKATRDAAFRRWSRKASERFRTVIVERLQAARDAGEIDPELDLKATAVLLAAALDGLLFHHLVDPQLDVMQVAGSIDAMLGVKGRDRTSAAPRRHGQKRR